ncbi:MAG TPA: DUF2007 domain-containing protein [Gemmataceae bacterium]|jgi:hypothetical protein|nr:DUF2007 domain-containing protein [Gemmataceae bacterium]
MSDDPDELVTVAVLPGETEANLVKNQLGAAGIDAYLDGAEAAAMAWHMAGAFGGVKVQVAAADAEDARALLEKRAWQDEPDDAKTAVATAETLEKLGEDDEVLSEREKNAGRAIRAAVFGLLLFPLWAYATLLLLKVYSSPEKLEGRPRIYAKAAAWVMGAGLLLMVLVVAMAIFGPVRPKVDLRQFAHPEAMVGTWEGTYQGDKGKITSILTINRNGTVHYQESGAEEIDCTGTWAFDNWTLYVRYDRYLKGNNPLQGQIVGFPVEDFQNSTMLLVTAKEKIRMVKRP